MPDRLHQDHCVGRDYKQVRLSLLPGSALNESGFGANATEKGEWFQVRLVTGDQRYEVGPLVSGD